jgi:hypothetical protein
MYKYRWFDASLDLPLSKFTRSLKERPFLRGDEDSEGFRVESVSATELRAQYIENQVILDVVELPTGERFEQPISKISVTDFVLFFNTRPGLQLINPARRNLSFFNALSEASNFKVYFGAVDVDVDLWLSKIEERLGPLCVSYMDYSGVSLSSDIQARVAIAGTPDIRKQSREFLKARGRTVERTKFVLEEFANFGTIELASAGWAKLGSAPEDELIGDLKECLAAVARQ